MSEISPPDGGRKQRSLTVRIGWLCLYWLISLLIIGGVEFLLHFAVMGPIVRH